MPPDTDSLKSQLNSVFRKSKYAGQKFYLPNDDLERIITVPSVKHYCSTYAATTLKDETSKVIDYVFGSEDNNSGSARQVFAILVLVDRPRLIPGVFAENIRDHDLPLAQCHRRGAEFELARRSERRHALDCFSQWDMSDRMSFDVIQYQVNVPVFKLLGQNKVCFLPEQYVAMKLDDRSVLPFTKYDGEKQIVSGSSKVVRVKIHPAHHDFNKHVSRPTRPSSESQAMIPKHVSHAHMNCFKPEK